MNGPDDLLEEPLFLHGAFIRTWAEFARLPRPDEADDPRTPAVPGAALYAARGAVPQPRPAPEQFVRPAPWTPL